MGRYLPGHKDGGPLRTVINLTEALGDEYQFYIGCYDRDHGDTEAYSDIKKNQWNKVGKANVYYTEPGGFSEKLILKLVKGKDMIYLCSFYEPYGYKTLLLKQRNKLKCPVAVASMGVFAKEAQQKKAIKKQLFILMCKWLNLFRNITWSVTSELEATDVKRVLGNGIRYVVAEDLPRTNVPGRKKNFTPILRIAFLSRICEHKNPEYVIKAVELMKYNKNVEVGFFGPIEEDKYWSKCLKQLESVHFKWVYGGDVPSDEVQNVLAGYDVFVLPSKSENYGHVVFEALSVGCIPVISDRTSWHDLEKEHAGFICKLDPKQFAEKMDAIMKMEPSEKNEISNNAISYAKKKVKMAIDNTGYRKIFG